MTTFQGRNVNSVYYTAMTSFINMNRTFQSSRNGKMLELPGPVMSIFNNPEENVLFDYDRDANPFFHLMESVWMLAGCQNVEWPSRFAKNLRNYSDDGVILNGAYGHRWRKSFGFDQIEWLVQELSNTPDSRRAVLSMWDPRHDVDSIRVGSADVPCNTHIYFKIRDDRLNMTVCNRSNDAVWGLYGANCVHFSFLQKFIALQLGRAVGVYTHLSDSLHVYPDVPLVQRILKNPLDLPKEDYRFGLSTMSWDDPTGFRRALDVWRESMDRNDPVRKIPKTSHRFFENVLRPMLAAHEAFKEEAWDIAFQSLGDVHSPDWKLAAHCWLQRRQSEKI